MVDWFNQRGSSMNRILNIKQAMEPGRTVLGHWFQSDPMRVGLAFGALCVYTILFFPIYTLLGGGGAAFATIPVIVVGWLLGFRAGLAVGIGSFLLNTLLLNLVGYQPGGWDI